jgi:type IX secretion system PorP/SprF family membrane protein
MKKILFSFIGLIFLSIGNIQAQQVPHYTQYMYNMNILNPAYAGSRGTEVISLGTLYRSQWHNEPGAPKTLTFNAHGALNENNGLGLSFINDGYGPVSQNAITVDYSHTLNFGKSHLAMGIKAGVNLFKAGLNDLYVIHSGDPLFNNNISDTHFNVGAGLFYYTDNYYLSFSVPNFLKNTYNASSSLYKSTDEIHMFLAGGYVFNIGDNFKLKPHFLAFKGGAAPLQADLNLNMLFANRFEVGISHRLKDAIGGMFNVKLFEGFRIGYAYDRHISDIRFYNPSSHEFFMNYDWKLSKKVMLSPRYF